MAAFFSDEWFNDLESAIAGVTVGTHGEPGLALGQVVNGTPTGDVSYTLILGSGEPGRLVRGSVEPANVALVEDYASALAIVGGASVAELLAKGKIKIRGDLNALLGANSELQALALVLGDLADS